MSARNSAPAVAGFRGASCAGTQRVELGRPSWVEVTAVTVTCVLMIADSGSSDCAWQDGVGCRRQLGAVGLAG